VTIDPESIAYLSDKFEIEVLTPDVPPEIAGIYGTWMAPDPARSRA
jgi:hypothetical protein